MTRNQKKFLFTIVKVATVCFTLSSCQTTTNERSGSTSSNTANIGQQQLTAQTNRSISTANQHQTNHRAFVQQAHARANAAR